MMSTGIPYVDEVWNPVVGCTKCSPGCDNCWAEKFAVRLKSILKGDSYEKYRFLTTKKGKWSGNLSLDKKALDKPLHWRKPRKILTCSMGDLFHPKVPFEFLDKVFSRMEECPEHTFMLLTKRIDRAFEYYKEYADKIEAGISEFFWSDNIWLGVTICNQDEAGRIIPILLSILAAHRWLSIEPMLGPVDFTETYLDEYFCPKCREFFDYPKEYTCPNCGEDTTKAVQEDNGQITCNACNEAFESDEEEYCCPKCGNGQGGRYIGPHPSETIMRSDIEGAVLEKLDQVIIGCESGPNRRPIAREHIKDLYEQCVAAGVDVMVKQMAENEDGTGKVVNYLAWIKSQLGD